MILLSFTIQHFLKSIFLYDLEQLEYSGRKITTLFNKRKKMT